VVDRVAPVTLNFLGEFTTEWNDIMAAAALASCPIAIMFLFLERQLAGSDGWRCEGLTDWSAHEDHCHSQPPDARGAPELAFRGGRD
jgi:hypothetical protein